MNIRTHQIGQLNKKINKLAKPWDVIAFSYVLNLDYTHCLLTPLRVGEMVVLMQREKIYKQKVLIVLVFLLLFDPSRNLYHFQMMSFNNLDF